MTNQTSRKANKKSESLAAAKQRLGPVEYVPTASLESYAGNARRHPERQTAQLMTSIGVFGFMVPVLVDDSGTIIAGHGRIEAARRLGLAEVPVLAATGWTEAQIRAYRLADNRLAELGEWNEAQLTIELSALVAIDELPLEAFGWHIEEIDLITGACVAATSAHKPAKAKKAPVSHVGDVWLLASYLLHLSQGDLESPLGRIPRAAFFCTCVDAALRRWAATIGVQPVLADTGESFDEVAARRAREGTGGAGTAAL
jgi:hypothetical protein